MTPLHIQIMLACHVSSAPMHVTGEAVWNSDAAHAVRADLLSNDLITDEVDPPWMTTPRGKAWVELICQTPIPSALHVDDDNH